MNEVEFLASLGITEQSAKEAAKEAATRAAGGGLAVGPKAEAARKYAEQAGTGRALGAGLAEGATFGFSDEIQAALDQLLGTTKEPGYLTPEERTKILQEQQGAAYMGGDILASLATGVIPFLGQAGVAARTPRAAQMIGKAMPAIQGSLGALGGAGRAEAGERLEGAGMGGLLGAGTQALPSAGKLAGGLAGKAVGGKVQGKLAEKAKQSASELRRLRRTFEPTPEMKQLRSAQKTASQVQEAEKQATKSIFDEPVATMTLKRASNLQEGLFDARKALETAKEAEKLAASRAGGMAQEIAGAQKIALDAQFALTRNKEKMMEYAKMGGWIGDQAKKILTAPTIYAISGSRPLSVGQAEELAFIEAVDKGAEPTVWQIMGAAKKLMDIVAE